MLRAGARGAGSHRAGQGCHRTTPLRSASALKPSHESYSSAGRSGIITGPRVRRATCAGESRNVVWSSSRCAAAGRSHGSGLPVPGPHHDSRLHPSRRGRRCASGPSWHKALVSPMLTRLAWLCVGPLLVGTTRDTSEPVSVSCAGSGGDRHQSPERTRSGQPSFVGRRSLARPGCRPCACGYPKPSPGTSSSRQCLPARTRNLGGGREVGVYAFVGEHPSRRRTGLHPLRGGGQLLVHEGQRGWVATRRDRLLLLKGPHWLSAMRTGPRSGERGPADSSRVHRQGLEP